MTSGAALVLLPPPATSACSSLQCNAPPTNPRNPTQQAYTQRFTVDEMVGLVNKLARGLLAPAAAEAALAAYKVAVPATPPTTAVLKTIPRVEGAHPGAQVSTPPGGWAARGRLEGLL